MCNHKEMDVGYGIANIKSWTITIVIHSDSIINIWKKEKTLTSVLGNNKCKKKRNLISGVTKNNQKSKNWCNCNFLNIYYVYQSTEGSLDIFAGVGINRVYSFMVAIPNDFHNDRRKEL